MKSNREFGRTGLIVSPIGLGCSRLGSVLGASAEEAENVLRTALDAGITFFDTSNVYAQGGSERLVGQAVKGRSDILICTKVGKYLPMTTRLLLPLKSLIKSAVGGNKFLREGVRQTRSKGLPSTWEPAHLRRSVEASLQRLQRDVIDVVMLHSPGTDTIRKGEALGALADLQLAGKVRVIGVAVDDVDTALAALSDKRIEALQIPLHPGRSDYDQVLAAASARGVAIVAREVLGGPKAVNKQLLDGARVSTRMVEAVATPGVALALVGTTKPHHLTEAISGI
ncbi:aldo/keto reductase [Pseudorhizobium halotolerans]|uniref:Aldo/keto reductase n=1 Tax=Pseudorhizobium halotolerans TaxID=1233081 RepID=A0ABM8PFH1_9HYPH|nr:aldo/keto reductase [Pseudorhizobium halotolerans]CAD7026912.1 aldo/keto reductase [Pseudorhizobium halotolerans]